MKKKISNNEKHGNKGPNYNRIRQCLKVLNNINTHPCEFIRINNNKK